jgi:ABC-type branched-subunit amino acid transport system substrate-binding protein
MGSRRCASFVAPTVLIEIVVAACSGDEPVSSDGPKASPGEPIKIGVVAELSGPLAPYGASIADSALIAVAEINAAGGIAGRDVVAVVEDIESDATVATERATKLVEEYRADVVAGPAGSDANDAAFQAVVQAGGTLQLYPTIYEGLKSDPLFFSFGAVPAQQIRPLIDLLHNEFGSFAMLFSADYVWPQRSFEIARPIIEEKVGVVVSELFLPIVTEDFSELVAEVRDKQPDYILSLYPGAWVAALQALDEEGLLEGLGVVPQDIGDIEEPVTG